ncbi:MAG: hypothetical protein NVSMB55_00660 [Mycobacteriales bacterium]
MSPRQARQARALARLRDQAKVVVCEHAERRRREHGFSLDDVLRTVAHPEQTYGCPAYPDRRTYQRGPVAVIVDERQRVVVTVLLRVQDRWEHRTAA